MSPTIAACRALNDLVDTARTSAKRARAKRRNDIAGRLDIIAAQLDATRTRLVQEQAPYLDTAWAMIDAARKAIALYRPVIS